MTFDELDIVKFETGNPYSDWPFWAVYIQENDSWAPSQCPQGYAEFYKKYNLLLPDSVIVYEGETFAAVSEKWYKNFLNSIDIQEKL